MRQRLLAVDAEHRQRPIVASLLPYVGSTSTLSYLSEIESVAVVDTCATPVSINRGVR